MHSNLRWAKRARTVTASGVVFALAAIVVAGAAIAASGDTTAVSVSSSGALGNGSTTDASISDDGRYVAFESEASNFAANDSFLSKDIFVHDRVSGTTELISKSLSGRPAGQSESPSISGNGRFVAFFSSSTNLVLGDVNGVQDVFVYDRTTNEMKLASVSTEEVPANGRSWHPSVSNDGRVAFESDADNLVVGDVNRKRDIFVRDVFAGTTRKVSTPPNDPFGADDWSFAADISDDGRFVAFASAANNLAGGGASWDVFVAELASGGITRVSVSSSGVAANGHSTHPSISDDGDRVTFESEAGNLVSGDTNGVGDVFVHERSTGTTTLVSQSNGVQGKAVSFSPSISSDGRYVAFASAASNLVADDTNGVNDVFVHDIQRGLTRRVSIASDGTQADSWSALPKVSDGAIAVVFESTARNLVPSNTDGGWDVYVHEVDHTTWQDEVEPTAPQLDLQVSPERIEGNGPVTVTAVVADADGLSDVVSADLTITDRNGRALGSWNLDCSRSADARCFTVEGDHYVLRISDFKLSGPSPWLVTLNASDSYSLSASTQRRVERVGG